MKLRVSDMFMDIYNYNDTDDEGRFSREILLEMAKRVKDEEGEQIYPNPEAWIEFYEICDKAVSIEEKLKALKKAIDANPHVAKDP